jgi:hypothetical protein
MALLSKDLILSSDDLPKELVSVPEWGGEVYIRCLTAAERDDWEASVMHMEGNKTKANMQNLRAKLVARTLCDEDGVRMFSDADVAALGQKSAAALDRLYTVAARISKISKQDEDELLGN